MKYLKSTPLIMLLLLAVITSCKKKKITAKVPLAFDEYKLLIIANNGSNFFGYLMDDKPIWHQKESILDNKVGVSINEYDKTFHFSFSSEHQTLGINIRGVPKTGETYQLRDVLFDLKAASFATLFVSVPIDDPNSPFSGKILSYDSTNDAPGYLKILYLDTERRIITGEFEVQLKEMGTSNKRNITKGRFDIIFK